MDARSEVVYKKKLIEVSLPLEAINAASVREKLIRHGHPSTLHLWWSRKPLATARAMIFAQMVDDPSGHPDIFASEEAQETERQRLFRIIEDLVRWENTTNEAVLSQARHEILRSWERTCTENSSDARVLELFDPKSLPAFHDPFCGGGSLPLEAQRLGLEAYASDLNPVAVLINKAMIELPFKFAGRPPVTLSSQGDKSLFDRSWTGTLGFAEDIRFFGHWMRDEAKARIGGLYPDVLVTADMAKERPDLAALIGKELTVIAWLWARTVRSPNPAFADIEVPLVSSFWLSSKPGKRVWVDPVITATGYTFQIRHDGEPHLTATVGRKGAVCLMSGVPIEFKYIRSEGQQGRMGQRLMATVVAGPTGKIYLPPTQEMELMASSASPEWSPDIEFFTEALGFRIGNYGLTKWSDLFTERQLVALNTFSDLIAEARKKVLQYTSAQNAAGSGDISGFDNANYADAISVYLAFAVDRFADYWSSFNTWQPQNQQLSHTFARQALSMMWGFAEANPFSGKGGSFDNLFDWTIQSIENLGGLADGHAFMADAAAQNISVNKIVSTDPPYYDNIGYADLADFFYVWLRRSLKDVYPELFALVTGPKIEELVATPHRHGGREEAEKFFLDGMSLAMQRLADQAHPAFPLTIYYAFKQAETKTDSGTVSTGWETFLDAVIRAGFALTGTWPMRTELANRMRGMDSNALASSIVLVCRPRAADAVVATRREFVAALKRELPDALLHLQRGNIAPVDLAQAVIGPGMAVYTRYAKIVDAKGSALSVRQALSLINEVLDEVLTEQEGDFDPDTRWALSWFEQYGFSEGEYGVAETLSKAKNTSVNGLVQAGILASRAGKVRLFEPSQLSSDWIPANDERLTVWEIVHHLIRILESGGESAAAKLMNDIGNVAETARELPYRLYTICERKKRAREALSYNGLVQSWPELIRLSREKLGAEVAQAELF